MSTTANTKKPKLTKTEVLRLKTHWKNIIKKTPYAGRDEQLAAAVGVSDAYFRGMWTNTSMPRSDVAIGMMRALNCTPNEFFNVNSPVGLNSQEVADIISREVSDAMTRRLWSSAKQPTGDDVMDWWFESGGRLENYSFIDECFDLFEEPSTEYRYLIPFKIGARSLSAVTLQSNSHDVFQRTVSPLSEGYRDLILTAHRSSIERGPITSIESLDAVHPDTGAVINITYKRTLAPIQVAGKTLILNYSKLPRVAGEIVSHI